MAEAHELRIKNQPGGAFADWEMPDQYMVTAQARPVTMHHGSWEAVEATDALRHRGARVWWNCGVVPCAGRARCADDGTSNRRGEFALELGVRESEPLLRGARDSGGHAGGGGLCAAGGAGVARPQSTDGVFRWLRTALHALPHGNSSARAGRVVPLFGLFARADRDH